MSTQRLTRPEGSAIATWLLLALWALGTPVLAQIGVLSSATFFGEPPSPADVREALWALAGAVVCGIVAPATGLALSLRRGDRVRPLLFTAALVVSVGAGVFLALWLEL